jgi:VIT1/CCC1 family predicted Fe2+/Mn2+ transporter
MTPDDEDLVRSRQRARAIVTALLLGGLVVLIFAITIARISSGQPA